MKYSKLTYYLLAILCIMATSCVSDGVMDECPGSSKSKQTVKDARVSLVLNFAFNSSVTRAGESDGDTTEGEESERKIKDVHIYAFQNNQFKEEVKYVSIFGTDGENTRMIQGTLTETYDSNNAVKFVVIVNGENKKVITANKPSNYTTPEALYNQLVFEFNSNDDWSTNIPMAGMCEIRPLAEGENVAKLALTRAVAKVNVTVNEGKGLDNFRITEIRLCNYNTSGYCASNDLSEPYIPTDVQQSTTPISSGTITDAEMNAYENHLYLPEHKNIGVTDKKAYLEIDAMVKGESKTYTLAFAQNGNPHDVLRNYMYVFNIRSVKMDIDVGIDYEVAIWDEKEIEVAPFLIISRRYSDEKAKQHIKSYQ